MKRLLLDTNIYGNIIVDPQRSKIDKAIHKNKDRIRIVGFKIIRKELKSKLKGKVDGINVRAALLNVYDDFVEGRTYDLDERMVNLANDYHATFKELGGNISKKKLWPDYLIIACASIKNVDIVVSDDTKTMLLDFSMKAYRIVNELRKLYLPKFITYKEFKNELKKLSRE